MTGGDNSVTQKNTTQTDLTGTGPIVPLAESRPGKDGTFPILIITPGWGSSGYYSPEVLEAAAPQYRKGTQMFLDHPRKSEEQDRPERSIRDLAAVMSEDARWDVAGPWGPGLYARAKPLTEHATLIEELAPYTGLSHRAMGSHAQGEADGRKGTIIEEITGVLSVDFVTLPGRGGQVLSMIEAARKQENGHDSMEKLKIEDVRNNKGIMEALHQEWAGTQEMDAKAKEMGATLKEAQASLAEKDQELARLKEGLLVQEAQAFVVGKLEKTKIPDFTKERLTKTLTGQVPVKEGKIDETAFEALITEAVKEEASYIAKIAKQGQVAGMGGHSESGGSLEEADKALEEAFADLLGNEEAAKIAAKGRR